MPFISFRQVNRKEEAFMPAEMIRRQANTRHTHAAAARLYVDRPALQARGSPAENIAEPRSPGRRGRIRISPHEFVGRQNARYITHVRESTH